jgi:hypothetical protein
MQASRGRLLQGAVIVSAKEVVITLLPNASRDARTKGHRVRVSATLCALRTSWWLSTRSRHKEGLVELGLNSKLVGIPTTMLGDMAEDWLVHPHQLLV